MADPVWFWQRIVSPHMAVLAAALAAQGRKVTYVAEQEMSADRAAQGWHAPDLGKANLRLAPTVDAVRAAISDAPETSIHVCQGLRGNGLIGIAQKALAERGLQQWAIMETIDDSGWRGVLKRMEYRRLIRQWRSKLEGVLAIGHTTPLWLAARGIPTERIYPFAYFLPESHVLEMPNFDPVAPFRFLYVGQFIERKRVDLLLDALANFMEVEFEVALIGSGPTETKLRDIADNKLPGRVKWLGKKPIGEIPSLMAGADCIVLPSRHDGWGAVLSEALMAGTPAICSDACGAAGVVHAGGGGVFPTYDPQALRDLLKGVLVAGRQMAEQRGDLAAWARCLNAETGARYLEAVFTHAQDMTITVHPTVPWAHVFREQEAI